MYPLRSRFAIAFMLLTAFCAVLMPPVTAACTEPNVDFTFNTGTPPNCPPYPVSFTDRTVIPAGTKVTGTTWNFGDGKTSTEKNPVHSYATHGTYTVALKITSSCGAPKIKTKSVSLWCKPPIAGFSVDKDTVNAPASVHVTDTSQNYCPGLTHFSYTNTHDELWTSEQNPWIFFRSAGTYYINQHISKDCVILPDIPRTSKKITVNPALTVYSVTNLSMPNVTSPTTTVTTTVTPTVTTTSSEDSSPVVSTTTVPAAAAPDLSSPIITPAAPSSGSSAGTPGSAPAQNTPGTGTLSVVTSPPGAQVFVDDVMRGLSPANIPELAAGQHMLRLEKSGYRTLTVPVSIGDGRTTDYSTALEAESGSMGMVPVIAAVLAIAVIAGTAVWYLRKNPPAKGEQK